MSGHPALLLYCQHSLGIGHLKRSWALAEALSAEFHVVLASGGVRPRELSAPRGVEIVELPPVAQDQAGTLFVVDSTTPLDEVRKTRARMLLETYRARRPALVVLELFPFGRRKFAEELIPLLQEAREAPRAIVASSVRDLLVDRGTEQEKHDERTRDILEAYFDAVLVHTDPGFATLDETFRPRTPLTIPVHHTGFVVGTLVSEPHLPARGRRILVSGGGGRFAEPLYTAAIQAYQRLGPSAVPMTIVAGPLCPDETLDRLTRDTAGSRHIRIERTVPDLRLEMRLSTLSVSQCGYNTALDILNAGIPALVVPFSENGDSEQTDRARRLERLNAVRVLAANDLRPDTLAHAITETVDFVPDSVALDMDGAAASTRLLKTQYLALPRSAVRIEESSTV